MPEIERTHNQEEPQIAAIPMAEPTIDEPPIATVPIIEPADEEKIAALTREREELKRDLRKIALQQSGMTEGMHTFYSLEQQEEINNRYRMVNEQLGASADEDYEASPGLFNEPPPLPEPAAVDEAADSDHQERNLEVGGADTYLSHESQVAPAPTPLTTPSGETAQGVRNLDPDDDYLKDPAPTLGAESHAPLFPEDEAPESATPLQEEMSAAQPTAEAPPVIETPPVPAEPKESDEARQARLERETQIEDGIRERFTQAVEAKIARNNRDITPERQQFTREMTQQFLDDMFAAHGLDNPEMPQRTAKMAQATQEALKGLETREAREFQGASDHVYEGRMLSGFLSLVGTPSGGTGWFTRSEGRQAGEGSLLNRLHDARGAMAFLRTLNLELAYMKGLSETNARQVTGTHEGTAYDRITNGLFDAHLPLKRTQSGAYIADEQRLDGMWRQARQEQSKLYGGIPPQPEAPDGEVIEATFVENLERIQQIDHAMTERAHAQKETERQAREQELATVTSKIEQLERHQAAPITETASALQAKIEQNMQAQEGQQALIDATQNSINNHNELPWYKRLGSNTKGYERDIENAQEALRHYASERTNLERRLQEAQAHEQLSAEDTLETLQARKRELEASLGNPRR